jgi:hypothetical protein
MIHQWYMNKTDKHREPKSPKDPDKKEGERAQAPPRRRASEPEDKEPKLRDKSVKRRRRRRKK